MPKPKKTPTKTATASCKAIAEFDVNGCMPCEEGCKEEGINANPSNEIEED